MLSPITRNDIVLSGFFIAAMVSFGAFFYGNHTHAFSPATSTAFLFGALCTFGLVAYAHNWAKFHSMRRLVFTSAGWGCFVMSVILLRVLHNPDGRFYAMTLGIIAMSMVSYANRKEKAATAQ